MTLIPVSKISVVGFCWAKAGGSRWIDHFSAVWTGPFSSIGCPNTLNIRPNVSSPTGVSMVCPVAVTSTPRPRPSLGESMMQRTVSPPTCWATSITWSFPLIGTVSASLISGSIPPGNATSTTGPKTCATVPFRSMVLPPIRWIIGCQCGCRPQRSGPCVLGLAWGAAARRRLFAGPRRRSR